LTKRVEQQVHTPGLQATLRFLSSRTKIFLCVRY
jgi:hypothetical protein